MKRTAKWPAWESAICLFASTWLVALTPAAAQPKSSALPRAPETAESAAEPAAYRAAIDLAISEYELSNFAEARAQFRRAHELFPNARTFRGLGLTEFELRNYGDAIENLRLALESPIKALTGSLRSDTEALLNKAQGYVARLNLEVDPGAASVVLDGVPVELGATGVLVVEVGDHMLEFRAPGRLAEKRPVKVTGGEERTLRVVLHPASSHAPDREARRWYKNPWLWSAVGVVVLGAATGTALALHDQDSTLAGPEGGTTGVALAGPRGAL